MTFLHQFINVFINEFNLSVIMDKFRNEQNSYKIIGR